MRTERTHARLAVVAILPLVLAACQPDGSSLPTVGAEPKPVGSWRTTLAMQVVPGGTDTLPVDLTYLRGAGQVGPRVAEMTLAYPADVLAYGQAVAGEALLTSGKRLVVQDKGGTLRVVFFSADNLEPVDSGTLVRLTFRRIAPGAATVAFAGEPGVFAPAEANEGLLFGPAVTLAEE